MPQLRYVCEAETDLTKLPCVMHLHEDRLEILFIREGSGLHTIDGKQYQTKKGDVLIYNSNTLHDERANPDTGMSVYSCGVSNLQIQGLRENCLIRDGENPVFLSGEREADIDAIFRIMYSQIYDGNEGADEICNSLLIALLGIILRQLKNSDYAIEEENNITGKRIKKYIDDNYAEDLTLDSISKALKISESYLSHIFKEATGSTPIQYITNRRIGEAQNLLITTDYSATDIAIKVGYDNSNYFNTIFTKTVGMSPIKFRKRWIDLNKSKK